MSNDKHRLYSAVPNKQIAISIFDLHDTLSESRREIDNEVSSLLTKLLQISPVAVTSGSNFEQFERELLAPLQHAKFNNLYLFPSEATEMYIHRNSKWESVYQDKLSPEEQTTIVSIIQNIKKRVWLCPRIYGQDIITRGGQVSWACLGQDAPLEVKSIWDSDLTKRHVLKQQLESLLPHYDISIGGHTSVNINHKGSGKVNCVSLLRGLWFRSWEMLYIGNEFYPGGDDAPLLDLVDCIAVSSPQDTKKVINSLLHRMRLQQDGEKK